MVSRSLLNVPLERLEKRLESEPTEPGCIARYHDLFAARSDPAVDLLQLSRSTTNAHAAGAAMARGILRAAQLGEPIPAYVDKVFGRKQHVEGDWQLDRAWDGLEETVAAFKALGSGRGEQILEGLLATDYTFGVGMLLLHLFPEAKQLQAQALDRFTTRVHPESSIAMGVSLFAPEDLKWLVDGLPTLTDQHGLGWLGVQASLMRAAKRGDSWDARLDRLLSVHEIWPVSDFMFGTYSAAVLRSAVAALPSDRAEAWFEAQASSPLRPTFTRLILATPRGNDALLQRLFALLGQNARAVKKPAFDWLTALAVELGPSAAQFRPHFKKAKKLAAAFEAGLSEGAGDSGASNAVRAAARTATKPKRKQSNAARSPKRSGTLSKLEQLTQQSKAQGAKTWVVALEALQPLREGSLSRVGGPGFALGDRHPSHEQLPMTHVFTLDLEDLPELRARFPDARALALYVSEPRGNDASDPDTDETALVTLGHTDIARGEAAPGALDLPLKGLRATRLVVAESTFGSPSADPKLLRALSALPGYAGGRPFWLQEPQDGAGFILQFSSKLAPLNLGDAGTMYVFEHTAFWQSR